MAGGSGIGILSFLWQLVWPVLAYDVIRELIAVAAGGLLGEMGTLCVAAAVTAAVLFPLYRRGQSGGGETRCPAGRGICLPVLLLSIPFSIFLNLLIMRSGIGTYFPAYREVSALLFEAPLWLQLAAMGIAVPLAEEIIFRGMVYERLREKTGFLVAAAVSAALFGLSHGNLIQGLYGGLMGLALAVVCEYFGGLPAAVLFHAGANCASVLLNAAL